ncbi:Phytosulfokine [Corchorus olitorius]|uniref:Phytosulfokine n=1 Tax=Corchorus olitorius TaxID=93759 RepID=A0A1R3HPN7_9ROSI|nr:Phytosulfokine [Corchorus olitorius]
MAKIFIFFILGFLLLSSAQSRLLLSAGDKNSQMPFSSTESSLNDEEMNCKGLDGEECLIKRSLVAHTDYIYTQENAGP